MRILHAPTHIGNQPWGLSLAERELGATSRVLIYKQLNPSYGSDENLHFETRGKAGNLAVALGAFGHALKNFDIFHFYFATSFFPRYVDLPILKSFGKRIFFTFQGCDIRSSAVCAASILDPQKHAHAPVELQQQNLRTILRHTKKTYVLNPDLLDASPTSEFLPYASVDPRQWTVHFRPYRKGEEVVIFHAPSDRLVKGTNVLEEAIRKLRAEGYRVRLDLVHGLPNTEVKRRAKDAHLVVDQLRIGWYGALAVETMALGKPTLCFIKQGWLERVPFQNDCPIINATVDSITEVLKDLLDHPETWEAKSKESRRFVETYHDPLTIARRLLKDYEQV